MGTPDLFFIMLDFGGGRLAMVDASFCVPDARVPGLELYGTEGTLSVPRYSQQVALYRIDTHLRVAGWMDVSPRDDGYSVSRAAEHLVDCVLAGSAPSLSAEQVRQVMDIL